MEKVLRYDFLFSYWMFVWFLLFSFLPKYDPLRITLHPAVTLMVGTAENVMTLVLILLYNPRLEIIWKFVAMMVSIKIAPLYYVMYETTPTQIPWKQSSLAFVAVFSLYLGYVWVQGASFIEIYKTAIMSVVRDENRTPLYNGILRMTSAFRKWSA